MRGKEDFWERMKSTQYTEDSGIRMLEPKSQMGSGGNLFHGVEGGYFGMGSEDWLLFLPRSLLIRKPEHEDAPTFYY